MAGGCSLPAAQLLVPAFAWASAARIASARLWPAQEYTRVVFEAPDSVAHRVLTLTDPHRVVLELDGVKLTPELAQLPTRVQPSDPYIAAIRFGTRPPETLRIVFDLKTETRPQLFALKPVAEFGFRVVLDLYPLTPLDPLMALLEERREPAALEPKPRPQAADALCAKPEPKTQGRRTITVALDPGHGGEDPGAIGRRGTHEKDVTLAIGRKLKRILDAEPGMRAMLTRDDDYFVPLAARVQKARRVEADLFVSIHADAFREARARGSSVFALSESGATSSAAKWLAQKENAADLIGGVNLDTKDPVLARTLLDLSQTAQISDSLKVGRHVLDSIGAINALAQGRGRAGRVRGAESARHSVGPGRNGVHLQSRRGTEAPQRPPPDEVRRIDGRGHQALLRGESAARAREIGHRVAGLPRAGGHSEGLPGA